VDILSLILLSPLYFSRRPFDTGVSNVSVFPAVDDVPDFVGVSDVVNVSAAAGRLPASANVSFIYIARERSSCSTKNL
jgi:hypothetical protein